MDVVEHGHDRLNGGEGLQQPAGGPERLLDGSRRVAQPDRRPHPVADQRGIVVAVQEARDLGERVRWRIGSRFGPDVVRA